jgi:hypothetical protein
MDPADHANAAASATTTPLTVEQMLTDRLDDDALEELVCVYLQNRFGYLGDDAVRQGPNQGIHGRDVNARGRSFRPSHRSF